MRSYLGLATYLAIIAAFVGGAAMLVAGAMNSATPVMAKAEPGDISPRIQAWLDREAEAKVFAEKEKAMDAAEKARSREIFAKPLPTLAEQAAMFKAREGRGSRLADTGARRETAPRDEARREAARRSFAREVGFAPRETQAMGFAPERPTYGVTAYQAFRDRGGL